MLRGRSEAGVRAPVVLEARFYYQYVAGDGRLVRITEGERFLLLSKSTQDWWRVRREGRGKKDKPFYVPASYVEEVPDLPSVVKRASLPGRLWGAGQESTGGSPSWGVTGNFYRRVGTLGGRSGSDGGGGEGPRPQLLPPNPDQPSARSVSALVHSWPPRKQAEAKGMGAADTNPTVDPVTGQDELDTAAPVYTNLQELKLVGKAPPSPSGPPVQMLDLWERHVDPASGRNFFINTVTKEKTWKPPRKTKAGGGSRSSTPPPGTPAVWPSHGNSPSSFRCASDRTQDRSGHRFLQVTSMVRPSSTESLGSIHSHPRTEQGRISQLSPSKSQVRHQRSLSQHLFTMDSSSFSTSPMQEKAGPLRKTKIAEGGRKLKKNWTNSWVVLAGNSLAFYKEVKSQAPNTKGNRPESSVDLRGSLIEWTKEMSSKKNVFRLRTVTGNEFLLQAENEGYISDWYKTIKAVIETLDRENPLDHTLVYSLRRTASAELLECSGDEEEAPNLERQKEGWKTSLRRMGSDSSERKRVKNRIKKFITRRPPLQTLQEKGLIKDQVFGCRLDALCGRERTTVPKFVEMCIKAVEKRGLDADGLYRVSGNLAVIQKLRFIVDHERAVTSDGRYLFPEDHCQEEKLNMDDPEWEDIHVITGALKMFFRELPEPLFPFDAYEDFVTCVKIPDYSERLENVKQLVQNLPKPNKDTMNALFRHFQKVVQNSGSNRMSAQSLSIVFGPTLMRSERESLGMPFLMVYQNQVVELVLLESDILFGEAGKLP